MDNIQYKFVRVYDKEESQASGYKGPPLVRIRHKGYPLLQIESEGFQLQNIFSYANTK